MISRSSSYNPPPSLGVASEKHEGGTDMDNSLNGVTGGCRSYRLLNGHSEEVIEIKIEKADGDVGEEYEDDGDCVRTSEPYLLQDQKSKSDARIEIDTFRSLSENRLDNLLQAIFENGSKAIDTIVDKKPSVDSL